MALSSDGNTALIGGPDDNSNGGAAWVFTRAGSSWTQQGSKLTASDGTENGELGRGVALSSDGNTALIGGAGDNGVGAAWVFARSGSSWAQQGSKITASDETGNGGFGASVALSSDGSTALIGGPNDNSIVDAAWVFTRSGSSWAQQGSKLTASDETGSGLFGVSVALSSDGDTALIGGADDNQVSSVPLPLFAGAAWVFTRSGSSWAQQGSKLTPSDESGGGGFGISVALSNDANTALIGGSGDAGSGAAWVFVSDDDLALAGMPANIVADASSPAGAVVAYDLPTAVDEDSPVTASVSCAPAPGSTFAIGATTVTCTATDADDTNSPVSSSFTVTVKNAATQIGDELAFVQSSSLPLGTKAVPDPRPEHRQRHARRGP